MKIRLYCLPILSALLISACAQGDYENTVAGHGPFTGSSDVSDAGGPASDLTDFEDGWDWDFDWTGGSGASEGSSFPEPVLPTESERQAILDLAEKEENQIPVNGGRITEDETYIPTEEELEEEDPGFIKNKDKQNASSAKPASSASPSSAKPSSKPSSSKPSSAAGSSGKSSSKTPSAGPSSSAGSAGSSAAPSASSGIGGSSASSVSSAPVSSAVSSVPSAGSSATPGSDSSAPDSSAPSSVSSAPKDGWYTSGSAKYYYKNGAPLTGWQTIDSRKYRFDNAGVLKSEFGIDVSYYQSSVDWKKVKEDGVEFAMIRVGFRGYGREGNLKIDTKFKDHVTGAKAAGLKVGVYFYSQAITADEAVQEANLTLAALADVGLTPAKLDLPVAYDIEEVPASYNPRTLNVTVKQRTDYAVAFAETIRNAGYKPMIYSNKYWFTSKLETARLTGYEIWLAHYMNPLTKHTDYTGKFDMWQYSDSGSIKGISGGVDVNVRLR